ncbi:flavin-containing monooxygenase [Streptomyces platensis]|uniref:flavin-containing monooxygenase n=1 Tax=Streptomyces platensis TaxID=58346 RepID=UPI0038700ABE|nr:NAD(P)/FAD-dependent oxidoreductase [Streptomyces platensis]
MTFNVPVQPFDADDDTLRAHLRDADCPALLMTLAHLTGDPSVLPEGTGAHGWLHRTNSGLSAEQQAAARAQALHLLQRLRDAGPSAPPPQPAPELLRCITSWAMGADATDLVPLLSEEIVLPERDPRAPRWSMAQSPAHEGFRVVIIGAGPSGLLAALRLAQAGVPFVVYEKNHEVGGTWLENRYPGCRVDVPSVLYSFSCATKPDWSEYFCRQDELLGYFRDFAKEFGLYEHIRFHSEVTSARWDEQGACWQLAVRTAEGTLEQQASVLVSAVGQLNRPRLPDLPGLERFTGPSFHSARWDDSVQLAGKRVAVIGTGASAFQLVPEVAEEARELLVFQRTPPWMRPSPEYGAAVPAGARWLFAHLPYYAAWYRFAQLAPGLHGAPWTVDRGYPPTERAVSAANEEARAVLAEAIQAQLTDAPELLNQVMPRYPVGSKRVVRDNGAWFSTLKRDDVEVVTDGIEEITPQGLRTADGRHHEADVLIYATGFQAERFLAPMTVTGRNGIDLHTTWDGDARAYLGMTVPGFPNLFCLYGPNTNLVGQGGSVLYFSECAVRYLLDAVRLLHRLGKRRLDVRQDVHDRYNARIDRATAERAWGWTSVRTWYVNDKGRSPQNWPFSALEYWDATRAVDPEHYEIS